MNRLLILIFSLQTCLAFSQVFQDITPPGVLPSGFAPTLSFGDMDGDGDFDIIVSGNQGLKIIFNDNQTFTRTQIVTTLKGESQIQFQTLDLGDLDRDGSLDILQMGGPNYPAFRMFLNSNLSFTDTNANLNLPALSGSGLFGDFDNDGDLDVIYSGYNANAGVGMNENGIMTSSLSMPTSVSTPYLPTVFCTMVDVDHDGQLDIIQCVADSYGLIGNYILKKSGNTIVRDRTLNVNKSFYGAVYADYDQDGDFDVLIKDVNWNFQIYDYQNGNFSPGFQFPQSKSALWVDINNDGLHDVLLTGLTETFGVNETRIYLNNGNRTFTVMANTGMVSSDQSAIAVADIDNDGDLDIGIVGFNIDGPSPAQSKLYINTIGATTSNLPPTAPAGLSETFINGGVKLQWNASTDDKTASVALTYNISVKLDDGTIVVPSHANSDGSRMICKMGNVYNNTFFNLGCLKSGTYHWSVQALDASNTGSSFAQERTFTVTGSSLVAPTNLTAKTISDTKILLSWVDNAINETQYVIYRKEVGNSSSGTYPLANLPGNSTTFLDSLSLSPAKQYTYEVVASNCAYPRTFSSTVPATTFPLAFESTSLLNLGLVSGNILQFCDFDNDKDLDILVSYVQHSNSQSFTKLFLYGTNGYTDSGITLPPLFYSGAANWIDLNNDGYLDLFLTELKGASYAFHFYKNTGKSLVETPLTGTFPPGVMWRNGVVWADYDNDGDQDMLIQCQPNIFAGGWVLKIFENSGALTFHEATVTGLTGHIRSTDVFADYDNDGDLDILVGTKSSCPFNFGILENNGNGSFTLKDLGITGLSQDFYNSDGDIKWYDYNGDGYLDILVAGQSGCNTGSGVSLIYANTRNKSFQLVNTPQITKLVYDVQAHWADYDNDGDTDILMYGDPFGGSSLTKIYNNNNNKFLTSGISNLLSTVQNGITAIGDFDNDTDLDYVIAGSLDFATPNLTVFKSNVANGWGRPNAKPTAPTNLNSDITRTSATLSWSGATDVLTPHNNLTYQFYLILENDTIVSPNAHRDGTRKIVSSGNARHLNFVKLNNLKTGHYKWGVQTIDAGYRGSSFSEQKEFDFPSTVTGIAITEEHVALFPNPIVDDKVYMSIKGGYRGDVEIEITDILGRTETQVISKSEAEWSGALALGKRYSGLLILTIKQGDFVTRQKMIAK